MDYPNVLSIEKRSFEIVVDVIKVTFLEEKSKEVVSELAKIKNVILDYDNNQLNIKKRVDIGGFIPETIWTLCEALPEFAGDIIKTALTETPIHDRIVSLLEEFRVIIVETFEKEK